MENEYYMIFRIPTQRERDDGAIPRFWGWSKSRTAVKVFLKQRNREKYKIVKMDEDMISDEFSENEMSLDTMLNYVELGDTQSGEMISFFTTKVEMQEAEIKIQKLMMDICSFDRIGGDVTPYVNIMIALKEELQDLLEFVGFCPKEFVDLFSDSEFDPMLEEQIYDAYRDNHVMEKDPKWKRHGVPGAYTMDRLSNKMIYSLQSFVAVLYEDLA